MVIDKLKDMSGYDIDRLRTFYIKKIDKTEAKINSLCIEFESMKETLDSIEQLQREMTERRVKYYESVNPFSLEDDEYYEYVRLLSQTPPIKGG